MLSEYRHICSAAYETKNSELRELATLSFKQPYCCKQGYTTTGRIHPLLLTDSDEDQKIKLYSSYTAKKMEKNGITKCNGVKRR